MQTAAKPKPYPGPRLVEPLRIAESPNHSNGANGYRVRETDQGAGRKAGTVNGADIQVENGNWSKIHNEVLMSLASSNLNGLEMRLVVYLLRMTYGWQRKEADLSYNQFASATNSARRTVIRYLNDLERKQIIKSTDNGQRELKTWQFNKYAEQWILGSDQTVPSDQLVTTPSDQLVTQYKDSIKKGKKGEREIPPKLESDNRILDTADARLPRQPQHRLRETLLALNAELPIATRKPLVDAVANYIGATALIEADEDTPLLIEIHRAAITIHKMGATLQHLREWWPAWKEDYRRRGATLEQFKKFVSEQMERAVALENHEYIDDSADIMAFLEEREHAKFIAARH